MSVRLTFACGHAQTWQEGDAPVCATCGERRVARTAAPAPRFHGTCTGPRQVAPKETVTHGD